MAAKIKFEFKDSTQFRIIHADGVFGGLTPRGDVYASFFNEHLAMPVEVSHTIQGTTLGDEIMEDRKVADAVERTMEVGVVMNLATARYLRDWLTKQISTFEEINQPDTSGMVKQ